MQTGTGRSISPPNHCSRRGFFRVTLGIVACCTWRIRQGHAEGEQAPSKPRYPVDCCQVDGKLFVTDIHSHTVWRWDGERYAAFYRGTKRYRTPLYRPWDIAPRGKEGLVVSDPGTMDIWLLRFDGTVRPFSARLTRPEEDKELDVREQRFAGVLDKPMAVAVTAEGKVFVADLGLHAVYEFASPGEPPRELAKVPAPRGLTIDTDNSLVVVSHGRDALVRIEPDGTTKPIVHGPLAPLDKPSFPHQVVPFADGGYLVSDGYAKTLWYVSREGKVEPYYQGHPLVNPVGLWRNDDGTVLVADPRRRQIFRLTPERKLEVVA